MTTKRGPSKAQVILQQAKERLDRAQHEYNTAVESMSMAAIKVDAYRDTYRDLMTQLAPKSRSNGKLSTPAPTAKRRSRASGMVTPTEASIGDGTANAMVAEGSGE